MPPTIDSNTRLELVQIGVHAPHDEEEERKAMETIENAIVQGMHFEMPSAHIGGLKVWKFEDRFADSADRYWHAWNGEQYSGTYGGQYGVNIDPVGEDVLGPALMRMRLAFADNQRNKRNRNERAGKLDPRVLGKRAPFGDDRLFGRKVLAKKKDYFVLIELDISGSTRGVNIKMIKEAALAQAELCHRMGIKFAVYAHTGSPLNMTAKSRWVDLYEIKAPDQAWDDRSRQALLEIGPSAANLDGHAMEFGRKLLDGRTETNKVFLYYSDGAMPAENYNEELYILEREIQICRQKGYTLLGVGVRTDSPARHGLGTVQIDDSREVGKVVAHLERALIP